MKHVISFSLLAACTVAVNAQQTGDRQAQWSREIYREVSLREYPNMGLYSPTVAEPGKEGIFRTLIALPLEGKAPVYAYAVNGNETLTAEGLVSITDVLDAYDIPFTEAGDTIKVNARDIPAAEVTRYYIKERHSFDASDSSFKREPLAICPVLERGDGLSEGVTRYPMFWIKVSDVMEALRKVRVIADYRNMSYSMNAADYFSLCRYEGDIYMERNPMGDAQAYDNPTDSAYVAERERVEKDLSLIKETTYDTYSRTPVEVKDEPRYRRFLFLRFRQKDDKTKAMGVTVNTANEKQDGTENGHTDK